MEDADESGMGVWDREMGTETRGIRGLCACYIVLGDLEKGTEGREGGGGGLRLGAELVVGRLGGSKSFQSSLRGTRNVHSQEVKRELAANR